MNPKQNLTLLLSGQGGAYCFLST